MRNEFGCVGKHAKAAKVANKKYRAFLREVCSIREVGFCFAFASIEPILSIPILMPSTVTESIPHRPPFLFVDEIVSESPDGLVARRTWRADEDFYRGHYPGAPITPGVLLCEAVFQAGAVYLSRQASAQRTDLGSGVPLLAKISDVRFRNPVFPGDTVLIEVKRKDVMGGFTIMTGAVRKPDNTRILSVEFAVAWKVPNGSADATDKSPAA